MCRCDSFNTAQIQILSGHDTEESVLHPSEIEPPNPDDANQLSPTAARPASRGRAMRGSIPSRRPTSAASTMETRRFSPYPVHQRAGRSASPTASRTFESVGLRNEDSPSDAEDDDVDFWGGESPSMLPRITQTERGDDEEEEDYDDDDDSLFDCDELDDGTEDDADDYMELFGHR